MRRPGGVFALTSGGQRGCSGCSVLRHGTMAVNNSGRTNPRTSLNHPMGSSDVCTKGRDLINASTFDNHNDAWVEKYFVADLFQEVNTATDERALLQNSGFQAQPFCGEQS
ncbi:unnamed protein product [Pleuronectes platessa]|uniref:Uncharacterized protein n=1 Tax=Pleuronectes platessa TaxID=8262 RepID=A0A9N7UN25_PLEPL|nr:unnamed protein product [Pleuronectes platessa]